MYKFFICIILFATFPTPLFSRDDSASSKFGILGGFNLNYHSADFRKLPGVPNCCPRFESGTGSGIAAGLLYDMPLSSMFTFTARAIYSDYSADLNSDQPSSITVNGIAVPAIINHYLSSSIASINLEPLIGINILSELKFFVGLSGGLVVSKVFGQEERLVKPADRGAFENGLRVRNPQDGEIPDASSFAMSALAGISYELPLNKDNTLFIAPEIEYYLGLTPIVKDYIWTANTFRTGIAIKYAPTGKEAPIEDIFEDRRLIDTIEISRKDIAESFYRKGMPSLSLDTALLENSIIITKSLRRTDTSFVALPSVLSASVQAMGVNSEGIEKTVAVMKVEEFLSTKMIPLLNYVFFDENSSALPDRFIKLSPMETKEFKINVLFDYKTLDAYRHILNIIGKRMRDNPKARITVTGCNANTDLEKNNKKLSADRANTIKYYLTDTWSISKSRIRTSSRNLPAKPSNLNYQDGIEENRRAEITSGNWEILEPIVMNDTLRKVDPPVLRFYPAAKSDEKIKSWKLTLSQDGKIIKKFSGEKLPGTIEWKIDDDKQNIPRLESGLRYSLKVTDVNGKSVTTDIQTIPMEQLTVRKKRVEKIGDKRINKYSLILFNFDESKLNKTNRRITDFIKKNILSGSKVMIEGFTDRTGDAKYNQELSSARAENVRKTFGKGIISSKGSGSSRLIYDNALPEGRFYCRTVTIRVETAVK